MSFSRAKGPSAALSTPRTAAGAPRISSFRPRPASATRDSSRAASAWRGKAPGPLARAAPLRGGRETRRASPHCAPAGLPARRPTSLRAGTHGQARQAGRASCRAVSTARGGDRSEARGGDKDGAPSFPPPGTASGGSARCTAAAICLPGTCMPRRYPYLSSSPCSGCSGNRSRIAMVSKTSRRSRDCCGESPSRWR